MNSIFSARLRSHRKELKRTQEQMAQLLNVRRSTYGEYERGKIMPPVDKIKILADYFGISVDYLMGNTNIKSHRERSEYDAYDVSEHMNIILDYLQDHGSLLTFDGESLDQDSRQLLITSLENSLKMTKLINRKGKSDGSIHK